MELDIQKCKITHYPSKVLSSKAVDVDKIDEKIHKFAEKMIDIMVETNGIGLAAPQAGIGLRMFVISLDGSREQAKVYINPVIEPSGKLDESEEGCLSLPGISAKIKRYSKCKVKALDLHGNEFIEEAEGLLAKALQHENDHLEGTMIKDRMSTVAKIGIRGILKELKEKSEE